MSKREGPLKAAFGRELKHQLPHYEVCMLLTGGGPDRCIVGDGFTSFWEFKHGTPDFTSPGRQELICSRLAEQAFCRYVLWVEDRRGGNKRTLVVIPRIGLRHNFEPAEDWCLGFDHDWLVKYISTIHKNGPDR